MPLTEKEKETKRGEITKRIEEIRIVWEKLCQQLDRFKKENDIESMNKTIKIIQEYNSEMVELRCQEALVLPASALEGFRSNIRFHKPN